MYGLRFLAAIFIAVPMTGPRASARDNPNQLAENDRMVLEKGEKFELLSLDPGARKEKPKNNFHGWKVLGSTVVKDKDVRQMILTALTKGIAESDGRIAKCFNPRHGIRATHKGRTIDLVICFECLQVQVFGGNKATTVLTTKSPQPAFDKALREAKIPLPKPARK
jgi:hypothetical protein